METKNYGTKEPVILAITYEDSTGNSPKGTQQGTIRYTQAGTLEEVIAFAPGLLSKSGHLNAACSLQKRQFTHQGEHVEVVLTYFPTEGEEGVDGNGNDNDEQPSYELSVAPGTAPLAEHESLSTPQQKAIAKALADGVNPFDSVLKTTDGSGALMISPCSADTPNAVPFQKVIAVYGGGNAAINDLAAGKKTFDVPSATWKETTYRSGVSGLMNGVGKKSNPPGPNPGGSWIYCGANAKRTGRNGKWKVEKTWKTISSSNEGSYS